MSDMTYEEAQDIVSHVAAERLRWGKNYKGSDVGTFKILDALVALARGDTNDYAEGDLKKSLATANRQLGAAKAREAKSKATIKELREKLAAGEPQSVTLAAFPLALPKEPVGDVLLPDGGDDNGL